MTLPAVHSLIHWVDGERCNVVLVTGLDYGRGENVTVVHGRMWDDEGEGSNIRFPNRRGSWHDRHGCPHLAAKAE